MEASCSFKSLVGGSCGFDPKDRKRDTTIIPLLACRKEIFDHKTAFAFSGPENEVDLILSRAAIFVCPNDVDTWSICPFHRSKLGLGWTRGCNTRCRVPVEISKHQKTKGKWPRFERGIGKSDSSMILNKTGVFLQVGSGMCINCRKTLKQLEDSDLQTPVTTSASQKQELDEQRIVEQISNLSLDEKEEVTFNPKFSTPTSLYQPSESSYLSVTVEETEVVPSPKEKLNVFLCSRDISPIRHSLSLPWEQTSERTKRFHIRKTQQVVDACLKEIAPEDSEMLFSALKETKSNKCSVDNSLMEALSECYNNSSSWSTRRRILSIMADKLSFKELRRWMPSLTRYRFNLARHHLLLYGRGAVLPSTKNTRMYVQPEKLEHFIIFITSSHIVQDLPFGEKTLKLSSQTEIRIPNVIRSLIPEQIICQYQSYCQETGFKPMSRSSLCRVLSVCSASIRKSLQGLDNFSALGAKAFDDLEELVEKLGDTYGNGLTWAKEIKQNLKLAKRYFKGDYKVHVTKSSKVADHCRTHALSYPSEDDHMVDCDHEHDLKCDRCNLFPVTLKEIKCVVESTRCTLEDKGEMEFLISQSAQNIEAWKSHLLRSINQDQARQGIIKDLRKEAVLLVSDWAMKFLPRKFRESQQDWFGKRGIPWHITVAMTKTDEGEMKMLTFVHIFESCIQDSPAVLAIFDDVLQQLKSITSDITSLYLRQDNAGCYHSASTILGIYQVASQNDFNLVRIDFSDPQGGKGACDRKAATIKNHMKKYLNSGHDIDTAQQMKCAMESFGGIPGVRVTLCGAQASPDLSEKWEGVSFINNIAYSNEGITVWRAYEIGAGKFMPWSSFNLPNKLPKLNKIPDYEVLKVTFLSIEARKMPTKKPALKAESLQKVKKVKDNDDDDDDDDDDDNDDDVNLTEDNQDEDSEGAKIGRDDENALFFCPEEGCIMSFQRYSSLEKHIDYGSHKYVLEHETLYDRAMIMYATKLEHGATDVPQIDGDTTVNLDHDQVLPKGWALKSAAKRKRFNEAQKNYLTDIFENGESTGRKANPAAVAQTMRRAKNKDGSSMFNKNEYLTSQQIAGFFSRLARKKKLGSADDENNDEMKKNEENKEKKLFDVMNEVMELVSAQHPIMFDH